MGGLENNYTAYAASVDATTDGGFYLCGGFTTFSTFSLETLCLLERGEYAIGGAYALGSLAVCVLGVVAGKMLVRWALGAQAA